MKVLGLATTITYIVLAYFALRHQQTESLTTALDKGDANNRVTGRILRQGFGWPRVYMETATYQETITGQPPQSNIETVREAGRDMMAEFNEADRLWHFDQLALNLGVYLIISAGIGAIAAVLWRVVSGPN